jgi:hypothetical protein
MLIACERAVAMIARATNLPVVAGSVGRPSLRRRGTSRAPHRPMMTKTIKHTFHTIGDHGGDFARAIGSGTADFARRFGSGTADVARRVGPWRALIGLAMIGAAVGGGVLLARYVRARRAELAGDETGTANEHASRNRTRSPQRPSHVSH